MNAILLKIWDNNDRELLCWYTYGKNGKRRRKPEPVKLTRWGKIKRVAFSVWGE